MIMPGMPSSRPSTLRMKGPDAYNEYVELSYNLKDMDLDDIEHGILRGNRSPPYNLFRALVDGDPRLTHTIEPMDPRIHFALVRASSSCPPIDVYTAENIGEELNISGRTFLNAGGMHIDRKHRLVLLSRIFKWYGNDFGESDADRIRFIAPYLYNEMDTEFLMENAGDPGIEYQSYDWRLNRG